MVEVGAGNFTSGLQIYHILMLFIATYIPMTWTEDPKTQLIQTIDNKKRLKKSSSDTITHIFVAHIGGP